MVDRIARNLQRAAERGEDVSVCVLEKGSEPGAHILSGAVIETRALDELLPDWRERGAPPGVSGSEMLTFDVRYRPCPA